MAFLGWLTWGQTLVSDSDSGKRGIHCWRPLKSLISFSSLEWRNKTHEFSSFFFLSYIFLCFHPTNIPSPLPLLSRTLAAPFSNTSQESKAISKTGSHEEKGPSWVKSVVILFEASPFSHARLFTGEHKNYEKYLYTDPCPAHMLTQLTSFLNISYLSFLPLLTSTGLTGAY